MLIIFMLLCWLLCFWPLEQIYCVPVSLAIKRNIYSLKHSWWINIIYHSVRQERFCFHIFILLRVVHIVYLFLLSSKQPRKVRKDDWPKVTKEALWLRRDLDLHPNLIPETLKNPGFHHFVICHAGREFLHGASDYEYDAHVLFLWSSLMVCSRYRLQWDCYSIQQ